MPNKIILLLSIFLLNLGFATEPDAPKLEEEFKDICSVILLPTAREKIFECLDDQELKISSRACRDFQTLFEDELSQRFFNKITPRTSIAAKNEKEMLESLAAMINSPAPPSRILINLNKARLHARFVKGNLSTLFLMYDEKLTGVHGPKDVSYEALGLLCQVGAEQRGSSAVEGQSWDSSPISEIKSQFLSVAQKDLEKLLEGKTIEEAMQSNIEKMNMEREGFQPVRMFGHFEPEEIEEMRKDEQDHREKRLAPYLVISESLKDMKIIQFFLGKLLV